MALPQTYITEIKRILDSISTSLPGYVARQSQKHMIAAIGTVLSCAPQKGQVDEESIFENDGSSILCVQGPTGVGKSLGYLIGATVAAVEQKRKVVISSATVALQEQLVGRDVPFFVKHSGLPLKFALAKGRTRYVCHYRLRNMTGAEADEALFEGDAVWDRKPEQNELRRLSTLLSEYEAKPQCWNGDRDELKEAFPDELWSKITTDRHGCLNRNCPNIRTCAQMDARDKLKDADIIVANHDLLLADFSLGGGVILPSPEDTLYVLDEAHHLADKAVEALGGHHQLHSSSGVLEKLAKVLGKIGGAFPDLSVKTAQADALAEDMADELNKVFVAFSSLDRDLLRAKNGTWRLPNNVIPDEIQPNAQSIIRISDDLLKLLRSITESLNEKKEGSDSELVQKQLVDLGFYIGRVENISDTWHSLSSTHDSGGVPIAKWVKLEERKGAKGGFDFSIFAYPVHAGDVLAEIFFKKASGVVLTSATLMTLGNFDQLLKKTGLHKFPKVSLVSLPSPFDFQRQGELSIPDIGASAKDSIAHTAAIIRAIPGLIEKTGNRGTLVLFSSRKQMNEVAAGLDSATRQIVMLQGEFAKDLLLDKHATRIKAGKPSVLFGLQSFSEGLDLPGDLCAHVAIAKIPFAVPDNPVQETLAEWLESQGGNYFMDVAVPDACLKMIQSAGRLIRTETDTGYLTVLDDRLTTKQYGRQILNSLPPFRMAARKPNAGRGQNPGNA